MTGVNMSCQRKPMRYSHSEGFTEVCFDQTGKFIVTCGNDGDVRIFEGLDDDDPKFITVGEKVFSLALKNGKLVTASSSNTVQIHTFPEGEPDGILTRFTTNATHVTFNSSGTRVAAGSSDFLVKVVDVSDSSHQRTFRGHAAPVLSVAFDPQDHFLASSSCDGSVIVWNIEDQSQVIRWSLLQKSNDVAAAASLCRLSWQPGAGQFLAVPVGASVHVYERGSWGHVTSLCDPLLTMPVHVALWSPCARFLAAGAVGGSLTVWNFNTKQSVERQKHEKGFTVCSLAWSPSGEQIAYTDTEGCLGLLDGLSSAPNDHAVTKPSDAQKASRDFDALFDDDDDDEGLMDEGLSDTTSPAQKAKAGHGDDDEDDEDDFMMAATGRAKKRGAILEDENSLDTGSIKLCEDGVSAVPPGLPVRPVYDGPLPTEPQRAFQPGSTPPHLAHRFMMWNSVGIVRGYNDDQDNAIDVEFHDSAVHHAIHLTNTLGHNMADISQEAVLLASPPTDELNSKVQCLHFSSWDTTKDWLVELPDGEGVWSVCLGRGWAAVATSSALLRLFSIGGVQRELFSLPGNVVSTAAHGDQLIIVFHRATGFHGDQALGVLLLQLGGWKTKTKRIISGDALPLSARSTLSWLGFSAEGTPCYVDSAGVLRLLNRSLGNTWTPVGNTSAACKSRSDHYWVVGVHENPQQIRCIPCKGSRFPPTLPRPAVAVLPLQIPFCQTSTEKGLMEEQFWRSVVLSNHYSVQSAAGQQVDEESRSESQKQQQELLMKMFALSCKLEREFRCVELAEMMTQNAVTLAVRYASRSRRLNLAQRLSELALRNARQEEDEEEEEEEEEAANQEEQGEEPERCSGRRSAGDGQTAATPARRSSKTPRQEEEEGEEEGGEEERGEEEEGGEEEEEASAARRRGNPFVKETLSLTPVARVSRSNPFKLPGGGSSSSSSQPRLANILDNMTTSRKAAATPLGATAASSRSSALKPLIPRAKNKTQSTLLQMKSSNKRTEEKKTSEEQKAAEVPPAAGSAENRKPQTGFQLWLDANRKSILLEQPRLEETDVIREAMGRFRRLSAEERLSWTERARSRAAETACDLKKRKRREEEEKGGEEGGDEENKKGESEENGGKKKKVSDCSFKLSAFSFQS